MNSQPLMTVRIIAAPPQKIGAIPHGSRAIVPVIGGDFEGPRLRGKVVPGGGDWLLLRSDEVLEGPAHHAGDRRSSADSYEFSRAAPWTGGCDRQAGPRRSGGSRELLLPNRAQIRDLGGEIRILESHDLRECE